LRAMVKKDKEKDIIIEVSLDDEPENPYKNLGVIGEYMWEWHKYFEEREKRKKNIEISTALDSVPYLAMNIYLEKLKCHHSAIQE